MPLMSTLGALATQKNFTNIIPGSRRFSTTTGPGFPAYLFTVPSFFGANDLLCNLTATSGYTLEYWAQYITRTATTPLAVGNINPGFTNYWWLEVTTNGSLRFNWGNGAYYVLSTNSNLITINQWYSLAVTLVNSGGNTTIRIFINGTLINVRLNGTGSSSTSKTVPSSQFTYSNGEFGWAPTFQTPSQQIYLDEVRVSNIARYTSNYTPATSQFNPDSNTNLLWHFEYDPNIGATTPIHDFSQNVFDYNTNLTTAVSTPVVF